MYIVFEGVKGVGKTTVIKNVTQYLKEQKIEYTFAGYTTSTDSLLDRIVLKYPFLTRRFDFLKEYIYVRRSNNLAMKIDWQKELIIGDRSIITSYVTRFWRFGNNYQKQISIVDKLMPLIPPPDIVLYLKVEINTILDRIKLRKRHYGLEDESETKLQLDLKAYEALMYGNISKRLSNCKWIEIDGNQEIQIVSKICINEILKNINQ